MQIIKILDFLKFLTFYSKNLNNSTLYKSEIGGILFWTLDLVHELIFFSCLKEIKNMQKGKKLFNRISKQTFRGLLCLPSNQFSNHICLSRKYQTKGDSFTPWFLKDLCYMRFFYLSLWISLSMNSISFLIRSFSDLYPSITLVNSCIYVNSYSRLLSKLDLILFSCWENK